MISTTLSVITVTDTLRQERPPSAIERARNLLDAHSHQQKPKSDNELLAKELNETMRSLRVMTDERDALRMVVDVRKDDTEFDLQQLERIQEALITGLENQDCIAAAEPEGRPKAIGMQLTVENRKLKVDC